jgi:hypothetical protein
MLTELRKCPITSRDECAPHEVLPKGHHESVEALAEELCLLGRISELLSQVAMGVIDWDALSVYVCMILCVLADLTRPVLTLPTCIGCLQRKLRTYRIGHPTLLQGSINVGFQGELIGTVLPVLNIRHCYLMLWISFRCRCRCQIVVCLSRGYDRRSTILRSFSGCKARSTEFDTFKHIRDPRSLTNWRGLPCERYCCVERVALQWHW